MRFAISKNFCSVPGGIVAPAAEWCPPPNPPTALLASCMTAARSSPRATRSRVVLALTLIPSSAVAKAMIGRSFAAPSRFKARLAAIPTTVSRIRSAAWKYWIASIALMPASAIASLHTAAAFEHVRDEGGHDPPLLSVVKVRPTPPVLLHLEVDPQLEQEGDARILIPAEPRDPGVGGVLQHLVGRPGLAAE